MLKFIDKVLTVVIDWLYLKRTILRLKVQAKQLEGAPQHVHPSSVEVLDRHLGEYGLSVEQLSRTGAMHRARGVDAMKA